MCASHNLCVRSRTLECRPPGAGYGLGRGHGDPQESDGDFGYPEMVADVVAVVEASGANSVITTAQAHGGWVAVELRRRLGERVPKMIFISWNPIITGANPLAPPSLREVLVLQTTAFWQIVLKSLLPHQRMPHYGTP